MKFVEHVQSSAGAGDPWQTNAPGVCETIFELLVVEWKWECGEEGEKVKAASGGQANAQQSKYFHDKFKTTEP